MTEDKTDYAVTIQADTLDVMAINVDAAVTKWRAYQELCRRILTDDDYATIAGKKARKRSGWRKLARFMHVSIEVLTEERWEREGTFGYTFTVRASTPDGQFQDGDGLCDSSEFTGAISCTEHNVRSKALTRAKNRATADLIGGGEVSAEELDNGQPHRKSTRKAPAKPRPAPKPSATTTPGNDRPWSAERLREVLQHNADAKIRQYGDKMTALATEAQVQTVARFMSEVFVDEGNSDQCRYGLMLYLFDTDNTKTLTKAQAATLIDWMTAGAEGNWELRPHVRTEANRCLIARAEEKGQGALPIISDAEAHEEVDTNETAGL